MHTLLYTHSHTKLEHGTYLCLITAQLSVAIVQTKQYSRECSMTEDWKINA